MGIFDRIILTLYTFSLILLSIGVMLLASGLVPLETVWTGLQWFRGRWEAELAGALFFLVSVRLLMAGVRSRRGGRQDIVHQNEMGNVHVCLDAVKNMVEKTARHTRGIRWTKVAVWHPDEGLKISIRVVVSPECNIPQISQDIQQRVRERIRDTVGVELAEVRVVVDDISNDIKTKYRVE